MIYTAYTVEVQTSFKGNAPTHFEIITEGGVVGDKFVIASHTPKFADNEEAIFFCNPNTYYPTDNQFSTTSMVLSATPVSKTNKIGYQYAYREVLEAIGVPINQFKIKQPKPISGNNTNKSMITEIEYDFGNVVLSGSNNQYLEFDVQAKANISGLDFGEAELYLEYTPQTFGTNVVGSGNIAFQKEDIILSSDYTLSVTDDAPDRIKIEVDVTSMPTNLHELSDIFAEDLLHMKIDISNFQLGSISFIGDMMQNETYHAVDNNGLSPFNNVIVPSPLFSVSNVTNHELTLTFENEVVEIDASGNMFYEFDIVGESDNIATFNGGEILINFNDAAFGNTLNLPLIPNALTATNITSFPYSITGYFVNSFDLLTIEIQPTQSTNLSVLQANTPTPLVRVRIPIADCNENPMLSFPSSLAGDNLMLTYYEAGLPMLQNFNLIHNDVDNTPMCPGGTAVLPSITSISTNTPVGIPIGGGIGTILTINGLNLGTTSGSVLFPNADVNDPSHNPLTAISYIYSNAVDDLAAMTWNTNQVTIPIGNANQENYVLGGGQIKLELNNGGTKTRVTSLMELTLDYSIMNFNLTAGNTYPLYHMNINNGGGYTFELQQNLANLDINVLPLLNEAIHQWQCETNINFQVSPNLLNIPNEIDINDNHNTIGLGTFPNNSLAAETYLTGFANCINNDNESIWYVNQIDIQFNENLNNGLVVWFFDKNVLVPNGSKDFFASILHELGHAHLLSHVLKHDNLGNTPVMYPFGSDHTNRVLQLEDIAGGDKVMDLNANVVLGGGCVIGKMIPVPTPSGCVDNTKNTVQNISEFKVFPNPANENGFKVTYTLEKKSNINIYLTNILGQIIFTKTNLSQTPNDYTHKISTQNLSDGLYFISIEINGQITTQKIIVNNE
jgi:hypothetical protein